MGVPAWRLEIANAADHDLRRLQPDMRRRVARALDGLLETPRKGDIKKLSGTVDEYRLRVGDWRIIFRPDLDRLVVVVLAVRHRSDAYRG